MTTSKEQGAEKISRLNTSGINMLSESSILEYKTVVLHVGFNENTDGFENPMKDMIEDKTYENNKDSEYKPVQFYPTNPYDANAGICNLLLKDDSSGEKQMFSEEGEVIEDKMIVEFRYDKERAEGWRWVPLRVRYDKTADLRTNGRNFGNAYRVANSNWHSIHYPITENMISNGMYDNKTDIINIQDEDVYYKGDKSANETKGLRDFHNKYVKKMLIENVSKPGNTLIDLAVGKAGDLHKWISSRLSFVLGVDISKDNIINRMDGACARYLTMMKKIKRNNMPNALFVNGDSSKVIRSDNDALFDENDRMIANAVFGKGIKDANQLGKGLYKNFGIGKEGFNVCSIQFAIHYMFENMYKLTNFLRNVSENTKKDGYFIATCYDGKTIFNKLNNLNKGESDILYSSSSINNDKKIWSITKQYDANEFKDDDSCVGYAIDVYQDTINKEFREYLVNYKFLNKLLNHYGFDQIDDDEAKKMNLPKGTEMFGSLHKQMMNEIKTDPNARNKYGDRNLSDNEIKISYLNRYFVFKKNRNVDAEEITRILMKDVIIESSSASASASASASVSGVTNKTTKVGVYNDFSKYPEGQQLYKSGKQIQFIPYKGDIEMMKETAKSSVDLEMYSITKPTDAENISYMIYEDNKGAPYILFDGTTSIGGNFIQFVKDYLGKSKINFNDNLINSLYGTEINTERFKKLKDIISKQFPYLKVDDKTPDLVKYSYGNKIINYNNKSFMDMYLNVIQQFPDINHSLFLDPPWGGREYKKYDYVLFGLGGESLVNIINTIKENTSTVVHLYIKVPNNFFTEELEKNNIPFETRNATKDINGSMTTFKGFTILYIKIVGTSPAIATPAVATPAPAVATPDDVIVNIKRRTLVPKKKINIPKTISEETSAASKTQLLPVVEEEKKEGGNHQKNKLSKKNKEEIEKKEKRKKVSIKKIRKKVMLTE